MTHASDQPAARIHPIADYGDEGAIRRAVAALLRDRRAVLEPLLDRGPDGLAVVKPNWVQQAHEYSPDVWEPVITHPAVVMAVLEELAAAMGGRGTICLCDAPHTYADFDAIVARGDLRRRLEELRARRPGMTIELIDLRREIWRRKDEVVVSRQENTQDPRGYVRVDLARDSLFYGHGGEGRFYGADYDARVVNAHHHGELQEYLLAGTPMHCDLFVNVPKLKTHKKTGITCCLKNLVGINGDKNWLPHHTEGSPSRCGDEFPARRLKQSLERTIKKGGRRLALTLPGVGNWLYRRMRSAGKAMLGDSETVVRNGNWHGNDTCWRMALDLNRAMLYADAAGTWRPEARRYLAVVDGIVGGQGNGPICPDPAAAGVLITGDNPAAVDATAARLMGFEIDALPLVARAFDEHRWPVGHGPWDAVTVADDRRGELLRLDEIAPAIEGGFRPHFGWTDTLASEATHG